MERAGYFIRSLQAWVFQKPMNPLSWTQPGLPLQWGRCQSHSPVNTRAIGSLKEARPSSQAIKNQKKNQKSQVLYSRRQSGFSWVTSYLRQKEWGLAQWKAGMIDMP